MTNVAHIKRTIQLFDEGNAWELCFRVYDPDKRADWVSMLNVKSDVASQLLRHVLNAEAHEEAARLREEATRLREEAWRLREEADRLIKSAEHLEEQEPDR